MARVAKGATNAVALCIRPSNHRNVDVVISAICLWTGVRCWHDRVWAGGGDWRTHVFYRVRDAPTPNRAVRHFSAFSCLSRRTL